MRVKLTGYSLLFVAGILLFSEDTCVCCSAVLLSHGISGYQLVLDKYKTKLWYWWFPFFLYVGLATLVINKARQALKQHAVKQKCLGLFFVVITITAVKCMQVFFRSPLFLGVSTQCLQKLMNLFHWPNCVSIRQTPEKCFVTV